MLSTFENLAPIHPDESGSESKWEKKINIYKFRPQSCKHFSGAIQVKLSRCVFEGLGP